MSDIFALDTDGQRHVAAEAALAPLPLNEATPTFFEGLASGTGAGVMRGGARVGQFIGMSLAAPLSLYERAAGQEGRFTDPYFKAIDQYANNAVDHWTPDPASVGTAGRVLGGLGEIALPLAAGGGNPALMLGSQEMGVATDLARSGVSAGAAVGAGVTQGVATAVGFKLPFLGKTLLSRAGTGAAGNLATNTVATAVQREILQRSGNDQAAAQFDPWDIEARTVDVLTGLAFGGLAHLELRASDRRAILVANNAKHFQHDTTPGVPLDDASALAHQKAMEQATDQILRGEPVTTPHELEQAQFVPRPGAIDADLDGAIAKELGVKSAAPPEPRQFLPKQEALDAEPTTAAAKPAAEGGEPAVTLPKAPEPEKPAAPIDAAADTAVPDVDAARAVLENYDVQVPTGDFDAEGLPKQASARKLMEQLDEDVAQAKTDAKGFGAAVLCFLQGGGA